MITPTTRLLRRFGAVSLLVWVIAAVPADVHAQTRSRLEVSGGYSFMRDPVSDLSFPGGWTVGATTDVNSWLAGVAEVSDSRKTNQTIVGDIVVELLSVTFGARASVHVGPFVEFAQLLGGVVHARSQVLGADASETHGSVEAGGGLEYPLGRRFSAVGAVNVFVHPGDPGGRLGREVRVVAAVAYRVF